MDDNKTAPQGGQENMTDLLRMLEELEQRDRAKAAALKDALTAENPAASRPVTDPVLPTDDLADLLIVPFDEDDPEDGAAATWDDEEGELPPAPPRRNPFVALWQGFAVNLPAKGDAPGTLVRKLAFLLALVVLIVSLGYIVMDVCVIPMQNSQLYNELEQVYQPENSDVVTEDDGDYPEGMLASFKELYKRNDEVRGWISYHATGKKDFLNIEYPVMFSGDNDKYLTKDFDEKKNKNGALFFDMNNRVESPYDENRSLIIYGHNMASGQMFAGLNKFIGSVNNARSAAEITMSTLYERNTYRVFAVLITDEDEIPKWYFNTRRTQFAGEEDFLGFVSQLRDRSLFDYPVEVTGEDELLVLSTCTAKSTAKVKDGRLVVVARKVRPGEGAMDTTKIQRNGDVIMPRSWYTNQGMALHAYYGGDHSGITTTAGKTTTTQGVMGTTGVTGGTDTTGTGTGVTDPSVSGGTTGGTAGSVPGTTGAAGSSPAGTTAGTTAGTAGTQPTTAGSQQPGSTAASDAPADTTASQGGETTATTASQGGETTGATDPADTTATGSQPTESQPSDEQTDTTTQPAPTETTGASTEPTGETPAEGGGENTENQ